MHSLGMFKLPLRRDDECLHYYWGHTGRHINSSSFYCRHSVEYPHQHLAGSSTNEKMSYLCGGWAGFSQGGVLSLQHQHIPSHLLPIQMSHCADDASPFLHHKDSSSSLHQWIPGANIRLLGCGTDDGGFSMNGSMGMVGSGFRVMELVERVTCEEIFAWSW